MDLPLLATKLYAPRPRHGTISRPRLVSRLDEGWGIGQARGSSLILLSASAGSGKTTLLGEWAAAREAEDPRLGVAWLSLDEEDSDPSRFLLYLAAALRKAEPSCGADAMAALQSPQPPSVDAVLVDLINEIEGCSKDMLLVLDDYQAIDSTRVDRALAMLIERLPPRMRLAIATREDPNLPLARLRAKGELTELRAADLRFTPEEAAEFLGQETGKELSPDEVEALEARTEGWIAGLRLAALSIQGRDDAAGLIRAFAGSHRYALDYLAEEVLARQPAAIQDFLLRTSILERLCGPLCDAVAGEGRSGQETLEWLERSNLFIIPLDDERRWYRYHHLFAELLRRRLGSDTAELHGRASRWFEDSGHFIEAFRHAAAAGDVDRAERLARHKGMPIHFRGALVAILDWLDSLPAKTLDERPSLRVLAATMSLVAGRTAGVEESLAAAERGLAEAGETPESRALRGRVAAARATLAMTRYEPQAILAESSRALEFLSEEDLPFRFTAVWTGAFASFLLGDRAAARRGYSEALAISRASGDPFSMQLSYCSHGEMLELDLRLRESAAAYRQALELFGEHPHPNAYEAHLGLARILYEGNELDAAEEEGERSLRLALQYDEAIDRFIICELFIARIMLARGRAAAALARTEGLEASARSRGFALRLPEIASQRLETLLRLGDIDEAERLSAGLESPASRARVLLARGRPVLALALIEPLRAGAEAGGRKDELLKATILLSLALDAAGRRDEALATLGEAIATAEGEPIVRAFLDEGEPMSRLLAAAAERGIAAGRARRLLDAFGAERGERAAALDEDGSRRTAGLGRGSAESLSERELEVLGLVAEGLSNHEIGERLFIALDTVKGHNRRIFEKLEVKRRTEAIARARELGLL